MTWDEWTFVLSFTWDSVPVLTFSTMFYLGVSSFAVESNVNGECGGVVMGSQVSLSAGGVLHYEVHHCIALWRTAQITHLQKYLSTSLRSSLCEVKAKITSCHSPSLRQYLLINLQSIKHCTTDLDGIKKFSLKCWLVGYLWGAIIIMHCYNRLCCAKYEI